MRRYDENKTSTMTLVSDAVRHVSRLIEKEIELAKAEVANSVSKVGVAIGLLLAAAILGMICLNLIAGALVALLVHAGLAAGWATILVAIIFGVIAGLLAMKAISNLKHANPVPTKAMRNVREDVRTVKEKTNG